MFPVHHLTEDCAQNDPYLAKISLWMAFLTPVCELPASTMSTLSPQYPIYHSIVVILFYLALSLKVYVHTADLT